MIQLLFSLLLAEALAVAALLFGTPLRRLVLLGLGRLKRGRGPLVIRTVAATGLVLLGSSLYSMGKIRARYAAEEGGFLTPTDQVLLSRHLLEASLIGYSLFLSLIIDRLHHYGRESHGLRKNMEGVMKQNRVLEEAKSKHLDEINGRKDEIKSLTEQIKQMKLTSEEKLKQLKTAEANTLALSKQSEGLLLEYDRVLEENQGLREQLQTLDRHFSHSDSKKNL
ncbi:uncharacterized protein LOC141823224 [Curcuma longa]|uniref:uncharacterized protein LOC141823224 n=1 Tax=Curcuma longa TaxID=136217 RepID=UPI003D9EC637